jgi:LuxR family transcriptional regulator, quorum-sensing system regulator BjaR1
MAYRNLIFNTIEDISHLTSAQAVAALLTGVMEQLGFTSLGINGLPPPAEDANPFILAESTPEGFRDFYIQEGLYRVDHICAHARAAYAPFRYSEAPYDRVQARNHRRFLQALGTFGMGEGLIVPIGRPANVPACVWLAGKGPDMNDEAVRAIQVIALFAASKANATVRSQGPSSASRRLTPREREVLQWISAGKTSWEISVISALSERAINKIIAEAMIKLDAVTRSQAVVNAIRLGEIEL